MGFTFITKQLNRIGRNARISIMVQPLWGIPYSMLGTYITLYMTGQGIKDTEVGFINSAAFAVKAIIGFLAGYIVNRMGRKKSMILFDSISIATSYFILIFATNYWQFLIANILAGFGVVNTIAQHCYLAEDVHPEDRVFTYNLLEILFILSAFFSPIAGLLIAKFQMIPAMRGMYAFAFLCSVVFVLLKVLFLKETSVGKLKLQEKDTSPRRKVVSGLWKSLRYVLKNRKLAMLIIVNIAINFASALYTIYYFLYLNQSLKYSEAGISVFPFITSVIALITLLFIIPSHKASDGIIITAFVLYIFGGAFLVMAPTKNSLIFVIVNVVCWAVSSQIAGTSLQAKIANYIDDSVRADIMSFSNAVSMLAIFPTGIIGGLIYKGSPVSLFYLILCIYVLSFTLFLFGRGKKTLTTAYKTEKA